MKRKDLNELAGAAQQPLEVATLNRFFFGGGGGVGVARVQRNLSSD